ALRRVMHKIHRPLLVRSRHRRPHKTRSQQTFPSPPPNQQSRFPVHPIHPLVVHQNSFCLQLQPQPPVSPLRFLSRRFHQARSQLLIVPPAHISAARLRHSHQLADPPLAHQKVAPQPAHFLLALYELHPFFSITAFSISLSRPNSRPTSAADRPASICFNAPIISTSLYFLFAMLPPSTICDFHIYLCAENGVKVRLLGSDGQHGEIRAVAADLPLLRVLAEEADELNVIEIHDLFLHFCPISLGHPRAEWILLPRRAAAFWEGPQD